MMNESEKYERILNLLRKSKPVLESTDDIEEKVISTILQSARKQKASVNILDYMFAWVYIGWIRKCLMAASVLLVILFGYQQSIIIKQIHSLNDRTLSNGNQIITGMSDEIKDKLLLYSLTDNKPSDKPVKISNRQMRRLIESVNELQIRYNDLINLINENPELKKYINEKITENDRKRFKL